MDKKKRIYLAAALIVVVGGAIGFLLRPAPATAANETANKEAERAPPSFSAPTLRSMLPPPLDFAAANRPDCFYLRVAYAHSVDANSGAGDETLRRQGAESGCWMGD